MFDRTVIFISKQLLRTTNKAEVLRENTSQTLYNNHIVKFVLDLFLW